MNSVGTPNFFAVSRLNSPACTTPADASPPPSRAADARLRATVDRYSFDVENSHLLLHAGCPALSHPPQTLPRHPHQQRRTLHRTRPLRLGHLLPPTPQPLHLPQRPPHRPRPRPPTPHAHLSQGSERLRETRELQPVSVLL